VFRYQLLVVKTIGILPLVAAKTTPDSIEEDHQDEGQQRGCNGHHQDEVQLRLLQLARLQQHNGHGHVQHTGLDGQGQGIGGRSAEELREEIGGQVASEGQAHGSHQNLWGK